MGNIYSVAQEQSWCTRRWGLEQCVCSCGGMKQVIMLWKGCWRACFNTSPHFGTLSGKCLPVFAQGIRMCQSFETLLCEDPGQMPMTVCWCGVSSMWDSFRLMAHGVPPGWGWAAAVPLLQQAAQELVQMALAQLQGRALHSPPHWAARASVSHSQEKLMSCTGKKLRDAALQCFLSMLSVSVLGCCGREGAVVLFLCWTTKPFHLWERFQTVSALGISWKDCTNTAYE